MSDLDWSAFRRLPGPEWRNWECLCHALLAEHFGANGPLTSVRVQPVVEFHLTVTHSSPALGDEGRQWGWQCKFWKGENPRLNTSRKAKITTAFAHWEKHLPGMTDWVLWTQTPLSDRDWDWIQGKRPSDLARVHTWNDLNVISLLAKSPLLRAAYFGETALTAAELRRGQQESNATLRGLLPAVHVPTAAQTTLGELRARPGSATRLGERSTALTEVTAGLPNAVREGADATSETVGALVNAADELSTLASETKEYLFDGLTFRAREALERPRGGRELLDTLEFADAKVERGLERPVAALRAADDAAERLQSRVSVPLVAVVGDAGSGKSHLASQLSTGDEDGLAGALVAAKAFRSGGVDLDRLAEVAGLKRMSIDELLAALDSAGAGAGERVPLIIDGIHESVDAPAWQDALARLRQKLSRRPNVAAIVTVRPTYVGECLPEATPVLSLPGFRRNWRSACSRYFDHFKIKADPERLPAAQFSNPLFLRIFCEATNPDREEWVELGSVPPSLIPALERFTERALTRIAQRLRVDHDGLRERLRAVALGFWVQSTRNLPVLVARELAGDDPLERDRSLSLAFEDEGLLDRDNGPDGEFVTPVFDALAGYLIADALLPSGGAIGSSRFTEALDTLASDNAGAFQDDVRLALGELVKRRADTSLRDVSAASDQLKLLATLDLISADAETVDAEDARALAELVVRGTPLGYRWRLLMGRRGRPDDRLNALWLDSTLSRMDVAARDLEWSEWIRHDADDILLEVAELRRRWEAGLESGSDELDALWLSWLLTTTDRAVRDRATEALYWYGRGHPRRLFYLTVQKFAVNDPYVPERLLAACYGVAMANQFASPDWAEAMPSFITALRSAFVDQGASHPTAHWLKRHYVTGILKLVATFHPSLAPRIEELAQTVLPLPEVVALGFAKGDPRHDEVDTVMHMDFRNYTLGRLFEGRGNYDFSHPAHAAATVAVLERVWQLGWRASSFQPVEIEIARSSPRRELDPGRVDRYGKKYSWIGFFEVAGRQSAAGLLRRTWLSDADIDPSFPVAAEPAPFVLKSWTRTRHKSDEAWVRSGRLDVADDLLLWRDDESAAAWVCVDGLLTEDSDDLGRRTFLFAWGAFVEAGRWPDFAQSLSMGEVGRHTMPEPGSDFYTFAGEIPWAPGFAASMLLDGPDLEPIEVHRLHGVDEELKLHGTAHGYAWEDYHSVTNVDVEATVPSRAFSSHFNLRGKPQTFDQFDSAGTRASRSLSAPSGLGGQLTFVRLDLIQRYATDHDLEFGWVTWGERELMIDSVGGERFPDWFIELVQEGTDQSRRIVRLADVLAATDSDSGD